MIESLAPITDFAKTMPPGLLLMLAAVPVVLLPHRISQIAMLLLPIAGLAQVLALPLGFTDELVLFGRTLEITRVDRGQEEDEVVFPRAGGRGRGSAILLDVRPGRGEVLLGGVESLAAVWCNGAFVVNGCQGPRSTYSLVG